MERHGRERFSEICLFAYLVRIQYHRCKLILGFQREICRKLGCLVNKDSLIHHLDGYSGIHLLHLINIGKLSYYLASALFVIYMG